MPLGVQRGNHVSGAEGGADNQDLVVRFDHVQRLRGPGINDKFRVRGNRPQRLRDGRRRMADGEDQDIRVHHACIGGRDAKAIALRRDGFGTGPQMAKCDRSG
jgi:hypothetical protein